MDSRLHDRFHDARRALAALEMEFQDMQDATLQPTRARPEALTRSGAIAIGCLFFSAIVLLILIGAGVFG